MSRGSFLGIIRFQKMSLVLYLVLILVALSGGQETDESDEFGESIVTLFTVANTDTGSSWQSLPFREKFQWKTKEGPCRPFKLRIPDERPDHEEIEVCIYRQQLDFPDTIEPFVHNPDVHYEVYEQRELQVHGFVKDTEKSVVFGRLVDRLFYGEVSFLDPERKEWIVYVVEEIHLLTKLLRHDTKVLHNLLYVMNKEDSTKIKYNAVVTQGTSLLTFMASNDKVEDALSKPFLIFTTSHNSYISSGEPKLKIDEDGRLSFQSPAYTIMIEHDGAVGVTTKESKYKFRPHGQTIVTRGRDVQTLHDHEGSVAIMAFSKVMNYDCVLPPPSFRKNRTGGFLCRICPLVDHSFQQYYRTTASNDTSTLAVLSSLIDHVSWIFRSVDWDLDKRPDNIGLEYDMQVNQWDPELGDTEYISKDDLDVAFTKLSLQDFSDCCLAIAYTMKAFEEPSNARSSIMSQSSSLPTGICAVRTAGISSNVILISANSRQGNYSSLTDDQLIYLTAHEIAKSFGAPLDATGKEICDQFKDEVGNVKHYIMWPDVLRNISEEEKRFSKCSIKAVHDALSGCRTACFENDQHPFCGNGVIEQGEECDCGNAFNCSRQLCCYARSGKFPCRKTGIPCNSSGNNVVPEVLKLMLFVFLFIKFMAKYNN